MIDRVVLQIAFYELLYTDTDPMVVVNESVEIAKKFSSEEASKFINGILATYMEDECLRGLSKT